MKSLFDRAVYEEIVTRINQLNPQSQRRWGKMEAAQMLAHSGEAFKVPLSETAIPRMFIGVLIGWMFKKKLYNDEAWKQNLPTAPGFIIKDQRNFDTEKKKLLALVEQFYNSSPATVEKIVHPMFGIFTGEQWGKAMYKHLDHHLTQFSV